MMHAITRLKDLFFFFFCNYVYQNLKLLGKHSKMCFTYLSLSQKVDSVLLGVAFSVGEMFQHSFK